MSSFTHDSFGHVPGCIGSNIESFKQCILDVHSEKERWMSLQQEGINFIRETHSRSQTMETWSKVVRTGLEIAGTRNKLFEQGEKDYKEKYPDVAEAVREGTFQSSFEHYVQHGQQEGKVYRGGLEMFHGILNTTLYQEVEKECPEGEELYFFSYPEAKELQGEKLAYWHWKNYGRFYGRVYICKD